MDLMRGFSLIMGDFYLGIAVFPEQKEKHYDIVYTHYYGIIIILHFGYILNCLVA